MSPNIKAQRVSIGNIGAAVTAIIVVVGAVTGATKFIVGAADGRYPLRTEYVAYQSGSARTKALDSLNYARDLSDVKASLARLDSGVTCLKPSHRKRPECQ